ncbi:hypothetical protein ATX61_09970, partial [Oenococcus oeni]
MNKSLLINPDLSEIKSRGQSNFPIRFGHEKIEKYTDHRFLAHWHPAFEIITVQSGSMLWKVDGFDYTLKTGDFFFINAGSLHSGHGKSCEYEAFTFLPELFAPTDTKIFQDDVLPIIQNRKFSALQLSGPMAKEMTQLIENMRCLYQKKDKEYTLRIMINLFQLWLKLLQEVPKAALPLQMKSKNILIKKIIIYIQQNYYRKITIYDIAKAVLASPSTCSHTFKSLLNMAPIKYLNIYRLKKASYSLKTTDYSITEVAMNNGFQNTSYFTQQFKKMFKDTPSDYR